MTHMPRFTTDKDRNLSSLHHVCISTSCFSFILLSFRRLFKAQSLCCHWSRHTAHSHLWLELLPGLQIYSRVHMSTWVSDQHRQFTATTSAPGESFLTRPLPKMPVSVFHHSSNRLTPNLRIVETALSHPHTQFINNSCWLYSQKISTTSHHTQGCHLSLVGCPLSSHLICSLLHYCAL